jgi:lanosterol synthase
MREGLRSRATGNGTNGVKSEKLSNGAIATGVEQSFPVERTDYSLWRLVVKHGRQTWHYLTPEEAKEWPQSTPDKYHLGLETVCP